MKKILFAGTLAILSFTAIAQEGAGDDDYELRGAEKHGYIINKKGEKIDGIVRLVATPENPWANQKKVRFIPLSDIDTSRKRQKLKKLDADDLTEYVAYEENGTERHFKMIKYTNTDEGMSNGSGLGGKIKTIKNLSSTTHLAEAIVYGRVTVYRLYGYPAPVAAGKNDIKEMEEDAKHLIENPTILYQKDGGKLKELSTSDIKELTEDCPAVTEKLYSAQYQTYKPVKDEKKRSAFGKMIKNGMETTGIAVAAAAVEILGDYNSICTQK